MKATIRFLIMFLIAVPSLFAQGARKDDISLVNNGGIAFIGTGSTVRVCTQPASGTPCTPLANIYSDSALTQQITNPFPTDSNGNYFFYALPGIYDIQVTPIGGSTQNFPDQVLFSSSNAASGFFVKSVPTCASNLIFTPGGPVSFSVNTAFLLQLNCNVTSSSVGGSPQIGSVMQFSIVNSGGFSFAWPPNFINPPTILSSPGVETDASFWFDGTNWHIQNNNFGAAASGCTPTGVLGDIPKNNGVGGCTTSSINDSNSTVNVGNPTNFNATVRPKGPNPWVDVTNPAFGAVGVSPSGFGTTGNCVSGNTSISIASASSFQNGYGIDLLGCGPSATVVTPSAPTVTPSTATAPTGTGYVVSGPTGSNTWCYQIAAVGDDQSMSAASPETCISNGLAALGSVHSVGGISSVSLATVIGIPTRNINTWTTSAPHTLQVGQMIQISGTSDDKTFGGFNIVQTVPDNTHFTTYGNISTFNSPNTSATGGDYYSFVSNHITLPTSPAGTLPFNYAIYRSTSSGTETFLATSTPLNNNLLGDAAYLFFDDYGTTMSGNALRPAWIPNTPPASAQAATLATTITAGGQTTTLTLAVAPSQNTTGSAVNFDDAPAITAANAFAVANGGMVHFPALAPGLTYLLNTKVTINGWFNYEGQINLNDTLISGNGFYGDRLPNTNCGKAQFATGCHTPIFVITANPGIYHKGVFSDRGFSVIAGNNLYNMIYAVGAVNIPIGIITDAELVSTSANDYMGVPLTIWTSGSGVRMQNVLISSGPNQVTGSTATPLYICRSCGQQKYDGVFLNRRGMALIGSSRGEFDGGGYEQQGGITPLFTFFSPSSAQVNFSIKNYVLDTSGHEMVTNLGGFTDFNLRFSEVFTGGGTFVTGVPYTTTDLGPSTNTAGSSYDSNLAGGNRDTKFSNAERLIDGTINTGNNSNGLPYDAIDRQQIIGAPYGIYSNPGKGVAPTCAVVSGGSLSIGAHTFAYIPVFPNGATAQASYSCSVTTTSGNQRVNFSGVSYPGASAYYESRDGFMTGLNGGGCGTAAAVTFDDGTNGGCATAQPTAPGSGISGFRSGSMFGLAHDLLPTTADPTPLTNLVRLFNKNNWPTFNVNGSANNYITGSWLSTVSWTNNDCVKINTATVVPTLTDAGVQCGVGSSHTVSTPLQCSDTSGSGTTQVCTTTPSFTPVKGDLLVYYTTTTNTGALTENVNATGAASVLKFSSGTWIPLQASDVVANKPLVELFDGTNWLVFIGGSASGNCPAGVPLSLLFNNSGVCGGIAMPLTPKNVPQAITTTPPGGGVGAVAGPHLAGVVPRVTVCPSNVDTILATDRAGLIEWNDASACAVTLPQAGSGAGTDNDFTNNFLFLGCNIGAGTVTVTPTTSNITYLLSGIVHSAQTSMPVVTSQCAFTYSDNTNYFAVIISATGVTSFTGDSLVYSNSGSTGTVTLTLNTQLANKVFANCTGSTATPTFCSITTAMLPGNGVTTINATSCTIGSSCTTPPAAITVANASSIGTTVNTLTKFIGAPSTAVIMATTDTNGARGITTAGAGTTGSATIQLLGLVSCVFDGATIAGDYVQISATVSGNCHDTGSSSYPTSGSGDVIGVVLSTNGAGGTFSIDLFPQEIASGVNNVTAAANLTNNIPAIGAGSKTLSAGYTFTPGSVTSGKLACYTSSGTVGNCTGLAGVIGVFTSTTTFTAGGETSVTLDATQNVTFGDNLCASSSSFGTAHDNGATACTTGLGIGIVKTTAASVSSATAFIALR